RHRTRNSDGAQRSSSRTRDAAAGAAAAVDGEFQPGPGTRRIPRRRCVADACRYTLIDTAEVATSLGAARHADGTNRSARGSGRGPAGLRRATDRWRRVAPRCALILTYVAASEVTGTSVRLTDQRTGQSFDVSAGAVINAAGVWAAEIDAGLRLRPSRGTHLVFDATAFGNPTAALTIPIPGELNRFVFAMPEQLGRVYLGLTDEAAPGPIPDVPEPSDGEITFLLDTA